MIDDDTFGPDTLVSLDGVQDQASPFEFVLEVGRMHQNQLLVPRCKIYVHFQDFQFIAGIFVQANLADAQDIPSLQELGNDRNDFFRELYIFGFFGIDAQPRKMRKAELCRPLWLMLGQLTKIIMKSIDGTAIESRPKRGLAHRLAACGGDFDVVIRDAADHVGVRFDVSHGVKRET